MSYSNKEIIRMQVTRINTKTQHKIVVNKREGVWWLLVDNQDTFTCNNGSHMITFLTGLEQGIDITTK